jgi:hypothetical protein
MGAFQSSLFAAHEVLKSARRRMRAPNSRGLAPNTLSSNADRRSPAAATVRELLEPDQGERRRTPPDGGETKTEPRPASASPSRSARWTGLSAVRRVVTSRKQRFVLDAIPRSRRAPIRNVPRPCPSRQRMRSKQPVRHAGRRAAARGRLWTASLRASAKVFASLKVSTWGRGRVTDEQVNDLGYADADGMLGADHRGSRRGAPARTA